MVSLLPGTMGASLGTPIVVALYHSVEILPVQGLQKAWQGSKAWQGF